MKVKVIVFDTTHHYLQISALADCAIPLVLGT